MGCNWKLHNSKWKIELNATSQDFQLNNIKLKISSAARQRFNSTHQVLQCSCVSVAYARFMHNMSAQHVCSEQMTGTNWKWFNMHCFCTTPHERTEPANNNYFSAVTPPSAQKFELNDKKRYITRYNNVCIHTYKATIVVNCILPITASYFIVCAVHQTIFLTIPQFIMHEISNNKLYLTLDYNWKIYTINNMHSWTHDSWY